MRFISLALLLILFIAGCGVTPTPKVVKELKTDSTLQTVELTKHGVIVDMNAVAFEWESIKDKRVDGVYIYRYLTDSNQSKKKIYKVINNRYATHYVDSNVMPNSKYIYRFATFNTQAQSLLSEKIIVKSLPVLDSETWLYGVSNMPRSAKIIWRPHPNMRVKSYIIERKRDKVFTQVAKIDGRLNAEYIDEKLLDKTVYFYRIKVQTFDGIISKSSKIIKIKTKSLPKTIENFNATNNLPKAIKLSWNEIKSKDFKRYYLYRSDKKDGKFELIAKLYNNKFVDKIEEDGKVYFYRLSVIDSDNLESRYVQTKGSSIEKPKAPKLVDLKLKNSKIAITWVGVDNRAKSYTLLRREKDGLFNEIIKRYENIKSQEFLDSDFKYNTEYSYEVYALDKDLIVSKPSNRLKIEIKKLKK